MPGAENGHLKNVPAPGFRVSKIKILVTLLQQMLHVWIGHGDEKRFTESTIKDGKVWPKNGTCRPQ